MQDHTLSSLATRRYLNKRDAAAYLNISLALLNKLIRTKNAPSMFRFGVLCRFRPEDLERWASEREVR